MWQAARLHPAALSSAVNPVLAGTELDPGTTAAPPLCVVVGCAIAMHALVLLIGEPAAYAAAGRHPRNGQLYADVTPHLGSIRSVIRASGLNSALVQ